VKESPKTHVLGKGYRVFPSNLNHDVQRFSAFLELLILSILMKKFLEKPLFSQRKTQNTFSRATSKSTFFTLLIDDF
jgi:hypothetical protein